MNHLSCRHVPGGRVACVVILLALAACGKIPNDPDDVVDSDVVGSWILRNVSGDITQTIRFFSELSPPPVTSPYDENGPSAGPVDSYLWRLEEVGAEPLETWYGTYTVIRSLQLQISVEWIGNENNTLVRRIPPTQDVIDFTITENTMQLGELTFTRQAGQ